ncbi:MAG: amino terminal protease self-immunity [Nocardioides sp.]|nr:amino terminal protease self-immunity [Nocardioides sp.]
MSDQAAFAGNPYHPGGPEVPRAATGSEPVELEYQQLTRARRGGGWWSVLAVVAAVGGFILAQVVVLIGFVVWFLVTGEDLESAIDSLVTVDDLQPRTLLFLLLGISLSIPFMIGFHAAITGLRPRWLVSVAGRIRWVWLLVSMGLALVTLVVNIALSALLPVAAVADTSTGVNDFTQQSLQFLIVIVLLVPFQAAAEEYVFRGLMMQGFGSVTAHLWISRVVSVVVPAFVFALFHGAQSAPIFLDRFAFGVVAGVLAIVTGGIEAGIGYHVVNNWLAFSLALFVGDLNDSLDPEGGNGWNIVVTILSSTIFLALAYGASRLMKLQTTASTTVLAPAQARV